MANARPFLYGLKDINQYHSLHHLREREQVESLCTQFFDALNHHDYSNHIFQGTDPNAIFAKFLDEGNLAIDGLPKCDGLRRGLDDLLASFYALTQHFPKFRLIVGEVLIFVDEKFTLADVMVLFSTDGLPVGRNGEGGLCVLRWMRDGKSGCWSVRDAMHMQGSMGI